MIDLVNRPRSLTDRAVACGATNASSILAEGTIKIELWRRN